MLKAYEPSGGVLFEEKQKFPRWLTILMTGIMVLVLVGMLVLRLTIPDEENEFWLGFAIAVPIELAVVILFQIVSLEKIITTNGLYYRWRPWHKKYRVIEYGNIVSAEVRNGPPMNFGFGWYPGYGKYHNASKGEGLQLYLMNGDKIYFSTADITLFQRALQNLISSNPKSRLSEF